MRRLSGRLKAGADFAVLAREKSVDPTSTDGGFLGKIDPASLRAELRDALRAVNPGSFRRSSNYHPATRFCRY